MIKLNPATSLSESTMNLLLKIAWIEPKKKTNLRGIRISIVLEAKGEPLQSVNIPNNDIPML